MLSLRSSALAHWLHDPGRERGHSGSVPAYPSGGVLALPALWAGAAGGAGGGGGSCTSSFADGRVECRSGA